MAVFVRLKRNVLSLRRYALLFPLISYITYFHLFHYKKDYNKGFIIYRAVILNEVRKQRLSNLELKKITKSKAILVFASSFTYSCIRTLT